MVDSSMTSILAVGNSPCDTLAAQRAGVRACVEWGLVSILLPIYKTPEKYLREAIESLLAQTYAKFELLVYNDSPTETHLDKIVRSYADMRVKLIPGLGGLGIAEGHNFLLDHAVGEFVALQDHDDLSMPTRLEREVTFLKEHPEVGVVSGACWRFGRLFKRHHIRYPLTDEAIRKQFIHSMPVLHPACLMRRLPLLEHGIRWDPAYISLNDAKLFLDLMPHVQFANLDEIVYRYRLSRTQTSVTQRAAIAAEIKRFEAYFYALYPEGVPTR